MWKNIRCKGIASIEKLVGEYNIWELEKSPYGKFKIKIYQKKENFYAGYTNIHVLDESGSFEGAVGYGKTEEEALEDTIKEYLEKVSWKENWEESDFQWAESSDF